MRIGFVDTNVLVRYMTNDNVEMAERARRLFERVSEGKEQIDTSEAVIAETVNILSSKKLYNVPRSEIREHLRRFITLRGLKMKNKKLCLHALDLYTQHNLDFVDTLIAAYVEQGKADYLISFDKEIDRISSIKRQEP
jgi:predicted nucleic acid-binding protein